MPTWTAPRGRASQEDTACVNNMPAPARSRTRERIQKESELWKKVKSILTGRCGGRRMAPLPHALLPSELDSTAAPKPVTGPSSRALCTSHRASTPILLERRHPPPPPRRRGCSRASGLCSRCEQLAPSGPHLELRGRTVPHRAGLQVGPAPCAPHWNRPSTFLMLLQTGQPCCGRCCFLVF